MKTAKKHNVSFAAIKLGPALKQALPIWYHLGAKKRLRMLNNTKISDCLRDKHGVSRVADLLRLSARPCYRGALLMSNDFVPPSCDCADCMADTMKGCKHPLGCCRAAANLMRQVKPKWNPGFEPTPDGLTLTQKRQDKNAEALEGEGDVIFDPSLTSGDLLMEAFRVFVDPKVHDEPPAMRARSGRIVSEEAGTVYIEGPVNRKRLPPGSRPMPSNMGFVHFPATPEHSMLVIPATGQKDVLCQQGEVIAALKAVEVIPRDVPLRLL
ncbi:uncharacterized protein C8Q71DRAFT_717677, partial [Rhodofomes roseus]